MNKSERSVLLVIDMQAGLFSDPSPVLHEAQDVLSRIAALIMRARASGVPIIYTRFVGPAGSPLSESEPGSRIHPSVAPTQGDLVIDKDDSDAFLRTDLDERLTQLGATSVFVCGLQSEFCVDSTCRTGYSLGYDVVLVEDAHTTAASGGLSGRQIAEHHNRTLSRAYVSLASSSDVFESG